MIELHGVRVAGPGVGRGPVLDDLELEVQDGEVAVVSGATASGKSTLMRLLWGHEMADAGKVKMFDHDLRRLRRSSIALLRRRLGIVTQTLHLFAERSALANVMLALAVRGERKKTSRLRALDALGRMGLVDVVDVAVGRLSQGEAQRVALARAVVADPALLLLDEPTAHQGDEGRELVIALLRDYPTVVVSGDPAVHAAAELHQWRHLELRDARLWSRAATASATAEATSDATDLSDGIRIDVELAGTAGELASTSTDAGDDTAELASAITNNIVPFPHRSVS